MKMVPPSDCRTKVICTLGPATASRGAISMLINAGMQVARLNFSHGTHQQHEEQANWVKEEAFRVGRRVAILQDLQGPKLRVGKMAPGTELVEQSEFTLTSVERIGDEKGAFVSYKTLAQEVQKGQRILLDDGQIQLEVLKTTQTDVITKVLIGGPLTHHKGVNVPDTCLAVPAFSEKDQEDLRWGLRFGVDLVALSFVRTPEDIIKVRTFIVQHAQGDVAKYPPLLIAKIEKAEAIRNIDAILEVADGIMVARGDLGVELGPEKVPLLQKDLIEKANLQGKLVITATQMLESMTEHERPTRAEASDVANAVFDGTDAVMLSGETAQGKHPSLVVKTMVCILQEVEQSQRFYLLQSTHLHPQDAKPMHAIAHAAAVASDQLRAPCIFVTEENGDVAKLLSDYRPAAPIVVYTKHSRIAQQLAVYWGIQSVLENHEMESSQKQLAVSITMDSQIHPVYTLKIDS